MTTVLVTKKKTHTGVIAASGDVHVVTLTGPDKTSPGPGTGPGPVEPPWAPAGGTVSSSVSWARIYNPGTTDLRYTAGTTGDPPPTPAADGSVDGAYRLPPGGMDSWTVDSSEVVVKVTTAGTNAPYDVECG